MLGGASHAATAVLVFNLLGPTTPGQLDIKTRLYPVHYPGLLFLFPVPAHHVQRVLQKQGEGPLEFPDRTTPVAARICIYAGQAGKEFYIYAYIITQNITGLHFKDVNV